jgi:hypothetical protein
MLPTQLVARPPALPLVIVAAADVLTCRGDELAWKLLASLSPSSLRGSHPESDQNNERAKDVARLHAIEASAAWRFAIEDFHRPR